MRETALTLPEVNLPDTIQGCRERIRALNNEMASIRIQIATTDIRRQNEKGTHDPIWFHRSKTALRLKQQELLLVAERMTELGGGRRSRRFTEALLKTLRADYPDEVWQERLAKVRQHQSLTRVKPRSDDGPTA